MSNDNIRQYLKEHYRQLLKSQMRQGSSPFPNGYRAETYISEELPTDEASYYPSQIGVLQWMMELGRINIITEVSILHLVLPRSRGHLDIYAYLKRQHNSTAMIFD
jgi:hypothetical protein